jgi:hypothetical protein
MYIALGKYQLNVSKKVKHGKTYYDMLECS